MNSILNLSEITLYHGSKGGIIGNIMPASRARCDFGTGFYMGTNKEQAMGLVANESEPFIYSLRLNKEQTEKLSVLFLDGLDWACTVLACRDRVPGFRDLSIAKSVLNRLTDCDLAIGPIADDRMNEAMRRFQTNALTDAGLLACLKSVDYGFQVVAKTQKACQCIEIVSGREIQKQEIEDINRYSALMRDKGKSVVNEMAIRYARTGQYLFEIIQQEKGLEVYDKTCTTDREEDLER